jgi:hypothetical protein
MELNKQELIEKAQGIKAVWESGFNLEEEAFRTAVLELLLENLDYDPIELWKENKEALEQFENEAMTEEQFDDLLDESNEPIRIGSLEYLPSQVLKAVDPIAYRVAFNDTQN